MTDEDKANEHLKLPTSVDAHVVWVDDKDVHYRLTGSLKILQTPLERVREIVDDQVRGDQIRGH